VGLVVGVHESGRGGNCEGKRRMGVGRGFKGIYYVTMGLHWPIRMCSDTASASASSSSFPNHRARM